MNPPGPNDKELNDLLDFSAMFSPPVPGMPPRSGPCQASGPGPTVENNFPGYKPGVVEQQWSGSQTQTSPNYDSRLYPDNPNYNNGPVSEQGNPFVNDENYMNKNNEMPYSRSSYSSRENTGMLPNNNVSVSPNSIHSKPGSPYYPFSKRSGEEPGPGRGGKFTPDSKRRRSGSNVYSPNSDAYRQESSRYPSPKTGGPPGGLYPEYPYPDGAHSAHGGAPGDPWGVQSGLTTSSNYHPSNMIHSSGGAGSGGQHSQSGYGMQPRQHVGSPPYHDMNSGLPPMSSLIPRP